MCEIDPAPGFGGPMSESAATTAAQAAGQVTSPNSNEAKIERTRAYVGFFVVAAGVLAIAAISIFGVTDLHPSAASAANAGTVAGIIGGAIAGVSSIVSAYFGIRAASNVAQQSMSPNTHAPRNAIQPAPRTVPQAPTAPPSAPSA